VYAHSGWRGWSDFLGALSRSDASDAEWNKMASEYMRHVEAKQGGNLKAERLSKKMMNWINTQRSFNRKGMLARDRRKALDAVGFLWSPRKRR
jgi:hypothetical protein